MTDDDHAYGTDAPDAPVTRRDFERALRGIHSTHLELRDTVLQLAAQVVALTDELTRRIDGVEPRPAAPGTPAGASETTVEAAVEADTPAALANIRRVDARRDPRIAIGAVEDKYAVTPSQPPCEELLPLCKAKCCTLRFELSTQDLDEGILRWDYGRPYMIRQRASDLYCVHNDPDTHFCTVREVRPCICRTYDCARDERIWADFARRIPASDPPTIKRDRRPDFDLMARARERTVAAFAESERIAQTYPEDGPRRGPKLHRS